MSKRSKRSKREIDVLVNGRHETVNDIRSFAIRDFVPEEHINTCKDDRSPTIYIISKRGGGKSVFVRYLLAHLGEFSTAYAVVPTGKRDKTVVGCIPKVFRKYELNEADLAKNFSLQKEKTIKFAKGRLRDVYSENELRQVYILDDCISGKASLRKSKTINEVMLEGRHYLATFILTSQDIKAPTPGQRGNFDWIFVPGTNSTQLLKDVYSMYCDIFPSYHVFREVFNEITKDYGVMAINNRNSTGGISDVVFRARADINERPRLCLPKYWDRNYVRKAREKRKQKEKEKMRIRKKNAIKITTVDRGIGYRVEYPPASRDRYESHRHRSSDSGKKVSFLDIAQPSRY